jgi:hypothetical protein
LPQQSDTANGEIAAIRTMPVDREITRLQTRMAQVRSQALDLLFGSLELTGSYRSPMGADAPAILSI